MSENNNSLNSFKDILKTNEFEILSQYYMGDYLLFLLVLSDKTGDQILISIDKSHSIKTTEGIELKEFSINNNIEIVDEDTTKLYDEINGEIINDDSVLDPEDIDKLMDKYSTVNMDSENINNFEFNIRKYKKLLDKLKFCTSNIKYKLSVISPCSLCYTDKNNIVTCYNIKKSSPLKGEDRNICFVINLEKFIDRIETISSDIKSITKNLYSILELTNNKYVKGISLRLKTLQNITDIIKSDYKRKDDYQKSIDKLQNILSSIKKKEKKLSLFINESSIGNSIAEDEEHSFKKKNKQEDLDKLIKIKRETIDLLSDIKLEYNNFMLDFDYSLSDSLTHFNGINNNLIDIGVLNCKKKSTGLV